MLAISKNLLMLCLLINGIFSLQCDQRERGVVPLSTTGEHAISREDALLVEAIEAGNIDEVEKLIKDGIDINTEIDGNTPVLDAIVNNKLDVLKLLIEFGADLDKANGYGDLPLNKAIQTNNIAAMQVLIDNKVDINKFNGQGYTPLMVAVISQNIYAVETLIEADVELLLKNHEGKDALDMAIEIDKKEIEQGNVKGIPVVISSAIMDKYPNLARDTWNRLWALRHGSNDRWKTPLIVLGVPTGIAAFFGLICMVRMCLDYATCIDYARNKRSEATPFITASFATPIETSDNL